VFTLEKFSRQKQNKTKDLLSIDNSSANHSSHRWHF